MGLLTWKARVEEPVFQRPNHPINYPDGVAVEAGGLKYYIRAGAKYKFYSERTFESWSLKAIPATDASLANYKQAKTVMGFRDGSLILDFSDNVLYFISNNKRRRISNPDWLDHLNLEISDAIVASAKEVALHAEGEDLP